MFFILLIVTFTISFLVSLGIVYLFKKPIAEIFSRIIKDPISYTWAKYITFATFVVGISGGVRIHSLERFISPQNENSEILNLNIERWTLEVYRTIIETIQSIAWMYLVVFIFALIAYVIVRGFELKYGSSPKDQT